MTSLLIADDDLALCDLLKPFDLTRVRQAVERVRGRLAAGTTGALPESQGESPIESQLDALLRLLNRPQGASRTPEPAKPSKLIVQAQSRLLLVDQAEICFAAIDDGVIRVATQNFEVTVTGTESVPEPSTVLLLGTSIAGLLVWRRRGCVPR